MALIKQADFEQTARDAVCLDLGDIRAQGERLAEAAREEAARIIAEAKQERKALIEGARDEGHKAGFDAGHAEGVEAGRAEGREAAKATWEKRLDALVESWTERLSQFDDRRDGMLLDARQDVLRLAVAMGEQVAHRAIEISPDAVVDQVDAVLRLVADRTGLRLRLHPTDVTSVRQALPALADRLESARHVELVEDDRIDAGGCVLEMPGGGRIDAGIETQISRIVETLIPEATP